MKKMEINEVVDEVHKIAKEKGWWEKERTFGEIIALIHSEASEALEEFRNGKYFTEVYRDEKGKPCGIPVELMDIVIRVFDVCGRYGIDVQEVLKVKIDYNRSRSYRHGGKKM